MRVLYGYLLIPVWIALFAASSAFLTITWLRSLITRKQYTPYFAPRTIHYSKEDESGKS